ncbi:SPOR domain-containing protein [Lysobacter xanthus]
MAAKRGKTQARRSGGGGGGKSGGLPGWAWLAVGVALTLVVVLAAPRLMGPKKDGFFRPTPNPDAQPQAASEEAVVDEDVVADRPATPKPAADDASRKQGFDFYTLLPGKEVPMSDAELAASEQAEKAREQAPKPAEATPTSATATASDARPLPAPVDEAAPRPATTEATPAARPSTPAATATTAASTAPAATPAASDTPYILQAGAFQASGQAEELKAKIALLGLGARVESAKIGGRTVFRVRMGPYGTAGELAEAKRKLASGGLSAMAVRTQ